MTGTTTNGTINGTTNGTTSGTNAPLIGRLIYTNVSIHIVNTDNSTDTPLSVPGTTFGGTARFSFDGSQVVFCGHSTDNTINPFKQDQLFVVNADGTNQQRLTTDTGPGYPVFSPDGKKIAFLTDRDGLGEKTIYTMNVDGTYQTRFGNVTTGDRSALDWR